MTRPRRINWPDLAGELAGKVRPETRSKYFPKNPLRRYLISRFLETVASKLAQSEWNSLLDVGCGEGFVDYYLSLRFPGRPVTGLESDPDALRIARSINPSFCCLAGDGRGLPFPDHAFDAAVCIEVLEHIIDFRKVIDELARVSSGVCVISVPGFPWYQGSNFLVGKNWPRLGEHPDHLVRFTRRKLESEM
ncbi:MAG: class I SAM-dependent methyltransferase, partial [bacterium]